MRVSGVPKRDHSLHVVHIRLLLMQAEKRRFKMQVTESYQLRNFEV